MCVCWFILFAASLCVGTVLCGDVATAVASPAYSTEDHRVLRQYADSYNMQCPLTPTPGSYVIGVDQLYWVNENDDFTKSDQSVKITAANLIGRAKLSIQLYGFFNHVSCGYLNYNQQYVRIKMWNFVYIDNPIIKLVVSSNPSLISLRVVNETVTAVSPATSQNVNTWTMPLDTIRFKCEANYDIPCDTKYIWMYFFNPTTSLYEIWHKNDLPVTAENLYQIFIYDRYNSLTNRNATFSEFLKPLLIDQYKALEFQCASYLENYNLITKSTNLTLIKEMLVVPPSNDSSKTGVIIGAVLGSFFGLLLLLCLLGLCIYLCCCRGRRSKQKSKSTRSSVDGIVGVYPGPAYIDNSYSNFQSVSNTTAHNNYYPVDHASQFANQIEINNLNTLHSDAAAHATVRSAAPDVYLKLMTVPKDSSDDGNSYNIQYEYTGNERHYNPSACTYVADEDVFHHTERKDFYIQNLQQQHQQHEINVHYV